jgi:hypothetical protein
MQALQLELTLATENLLQPYFVVKKANGQLQVPQANTHRLDAAPYPLVMWNTDGLKTFEAG